MAKKRKTRQQKFESDRRHTSPRHQTAPSVSSSHQEVATATTPATTNTLSPIAKPSKPAISTSEYQFVRHDLLKTSSITGAIIIAELVLFFVLR